MAVKRRVNFVSQQRVDSPDMKTLDSAVSNDFDELIKALIAGEEEGYILRGFDISMAGAIGGASSGLQMLVDQASIFHTKSSQSGTFLVVPSGTSPEPLNSATNNIVDGAFAPSSINYVGIEYERFVDDTTAAQVYLWNPTTNNETTKTVPRAQVLRYRIKITTSVWALNVLPVCTVTTDAGNNVVSIEDRRRMLFRLGTAGRSTPNPFYAYPWTAQSEGRTENPPSSSNNSINPFHGGDKMLFTLKDWMDALMTSIQEIKGTVYWYSPNTSGSLVTLREDLGNTVMTGKGKIGHSKDVAGLLNWDEDIYIRIVGSRLFYKILANPSSTDLTLTDETAAYLNLVRGVDITPNLVFTNGSAVVTSVGAVAWTAPLQAGDWVKLSSETDVGYYNILSVDSASQVTLTEVYAGTSTGAAGAKSKYAFGVYQTSPAPSSNRHIFIANRKDVPSSQDTFWLFLRSDNVGTIPRIYIRLLGSELQQGEDREISDNTTLEVLQYIGSPIETAYLPQYVSALTPGSVPEITDVKVGNAASITTGQYFLINSAGDWRKYYVWFNKNAAGGDPVPPGRNSAIEVAITTGMTAASVAAAVAAAMGATLDDDFLAVQRPIPNTDTVRVTNTSAGTAIDAVNFNVGAPFAITIIQQGTGIGNRSIHDGDNLTLAIKELDVAIGIIQSIIDDPSYDETVDIVASGATPPTSLNGPVLSGTVITLPLNSRQGSMVQRYTVGKGALEVFLNGQYLRLGVDWSEVGAAQSLSFQITILQNLAVGDVLEFRLDAVGGPGGTGGGAGPMGPPGPAGPAGSDAAGGPVTVSTKIADYTVVNADVVLLADCSSAPITFTLPTAASAIGQIFYFKKIDATANAMTIDADGSETIDGALTQSTTTQYESFVLVNDGTSWYII